MQEPRQIIGRGLSAAFSRCSNMVKRYSLTCCSKKMTFAEADSGGASGWASYAACRGWRSTPRSPRRPRALCSARPPGDNAAQERRLGPSNSV